MNTRILLLSLAISYTVISCNQPATHATTMAPLDNDANFPPAILLDSSATTVFIPTMEHTLPPGKNVIYSPAFLYAWAELRTQLDGPVKVPDNNADLQLISSSTSYKGSLAPNEYATRVTEQGNSISIVAAFKKGLPFKNDMDTTDLRSPFIFKGIRVKAFGMPLFFEKIAERIKILYYENDDKFIIKIMPADEQEEIILAKGMETTGNFKELMQQVNRLADSGQKELAKNYHNWKYELLSDDQVLIPVMRFNYKASFTALLHAMISGNGRSLRIDTASERNAFVLNEHGAKIESEAEVAVAAASDPPSPGDTIRHAKKLFLNKDFVLMLHKTAAPYPYFMMTVNNADIMERR